MRWMDFFPKGNCILLIWSIFQHEIDSTPSEAVAPRDQSPDTVPSSRSGATIRRFNLQADIVLCMFFLRNVKNTQTSHIKSPHGPGIKSTHDILIFFYNTQACMSGAAVSYRNHSSFYNVKWFISVQSCIIFSSWSFIDDGRNGPTHKAFSNTKWIFSMRSRSGLSGNKNMSEKYVWCHFHNLNLTNHCIEREGREKYTGRIQFSWWLFTLLDWLEHDCIISPPNQKQSMDVISIMLLKQADDTEQRL